MSAGKVFGVGVGPGDPGLLTVRAVELLAAADLLIAPRASEEHDSVARGIVAGRVSSACEVVEAVFPMSDQAGERSAAARAAADRLAIAARAGQVAVMVTLGDAMTYSTWGYVLRELRAGHADVAVETVPGVTSFAAAAARLGRPLAEGSDPLLVWPGALPDDLGALLEFVPNVVALKVGRRLAALVDAAGETGASVSAVRRLGMQGEVVAEEAVELLGVTPDYFTTALVRKETS